MGARIPLSKAPYAGRVFSVNAESGIMAAGLGAAAEILQFRVVDATEQRKFRVLSVMLSAANNGTAFAAGSAQFNLTAATAWTAAGTGGGVLTLTGDNAKNRRSQNTNIFGVSGEIRVATTAALTAGTKTLDSQGLAGFNVGVPAVAGQQLLLPTDFLQGCLTTEGDPLEFTHQQGFVIRATVPATGTWKFSASIIWAEYNG